MRTTLRTLAVTSALLFPGLSVHRAEADVLVMFQDGNPKDSFTIINTGCSFTNAVLVIDLRTSASGALIDTEYGGPRTQDPLPIEVDKGLLALPDVQDGEQVLHIFIEAMEEGDFGIVSMDLDDSASDNPALRIEVWGQDIAGSNVVLSIDGASTLATMSTAGIAKVPTPPTAQGCVFS